VVLAADDLDLLQESQHNDYKHLIAVTGPHASVRLPSIGLGKVHSWRVNWFSPSWPAPSRRT